MSSRDEDLSILRSEGRENVLDIVPCYLPTIVVGSQHREGVFLATVNTGIQVDFDVFIDLLAGGQQVIKFVRNRAGNFRNEIHCKLSFLDGNRGLDCVGDVEEIEVE
jgi:uncharacterized protein involved in tellurium resistance